MLACILVCPRSCVHPDTGHTQALTAAGLYQTVRRVLDTSGWYYMGTEYLECLRCKGKWAAWTRDILDQLDIPHQREFPAVLTYK